jgi:hypothetical protein
MNISRIKELANSFDSPKMSADEINDYIYELEARGSSAESHYSGDLDFRYKNSEELIDPGFIGNPSGYHLTKDITKRYHFQTEYFSVTQILSMLGYKNLRIAESVDPSSLSGLMNMVFEKKKNLEDRIMQLLGSINTVLKSIIAITYELKELDRNLYFYDELKDRDKEKAEAAELALKRVFLDNVDARKGGASLSALSRSPTQGQGGPGFIDIMSVFYQVKSLKEVSQLDRNEQYKSILKNRYVEYEKWKEINGKDLRSRKGMLLQYLKSQMGSFDLYVDWCSTYLSLLSKMGLNTAKSASEYMKGSSKPDIFENELFSVSVVSSKPVYAKEYDVEYTRLFKNKGPEIPISVEPKSIVGDLLTRGYKEHRRSYIYNRLKKYGPLAFSVIKFTMDFKEKPSKEAAQPPYEGTFSLHIYPYSFTPEEFYLYKRANTAKIQKTVFAAVNQSVFNSLSIIKEDLDKYILEAEKEEAAKKKPNKPQKEFAIFDIYRAFKDDFTGVSKSFSTFSQGTSQNKSVFSEKDAELYEMLLNSKLFMRPRIKTILETGLFISNEDVMHIYDELKNRTGQLNWKPPFSVN